MKQRRLGTILGRRKATEVPSRARSLMPTGNLATQQLERRVRESTFLMLLWRHARPFRASNPRYYIYGVLGMVNGLLHTQLMIDYDKSTTEVYLDATVTILNIGSVYALQAMFCMFPCWV